MEESIKKFNKQFEYEPVIRNSEKLKNNYKHFVLCGMGGSHLSAGIIKMIQPGIDLYVHRDYDLPPYEDDFLKESLLIASSHSGNTEEVLSFLKNALEKKYDVATITTGGKLFDISVSEQIPHIVIPDNDIEPRLALGYSTLALSKIMNKEDLLEDLKQTGLDLDSDVFKEEAESIIESISDKIPVIYASNRNLQIAYNWKIKFNETAKIPAFYNIFPELNHNEMQGFDDEKNKDKFHFIFINDIDDNDQIKKRMNITASILEERGYTVTNLELSGKNIIDKIFGSLLTADLVALSIALKNKKNPQSVLMIEDFKKRLND